MTFSIGEFNMENIAVVRSCFSSSSCAVFYPCSFHVTRSLQNNYTILVPSFTVPTYNFTYPCPTYEGRAGHLTDILRACRRRVTSIHTTFAATDPSHLHNHFYQDHQSASTAAFASACFYVSSIHGGECHCVHSAMFLSFPYAVQCV